VWWLVCCARSTPTTTLTHTNEQQSCEKNQVTEEKSGMTHKKAREASQESEKANHSQALPSGACRRSASRF